LGSPTDLREVWYPTCAYLGRCRVGEDVSAIEKVRLGLLMAASAVVAAALTALLVSPAACDIDWNALGTWFGGLMTAAAVAVAVGIALRDGRERDRARRDDEAAQARTITVTVEKGSGDQVWVTAIATITNHGTLPVLALTLDKLVITPLDDGPEWRQKFFGGGRAVLPPQESIRVRVNVIKPKGGQLRIEEPDLPSGVISFRDASGRAWTRWGNTDPQRVLTAPDSTRKAPDQGHTVQHVDG
jgi:hypothetical protein